MIADPAPSPRLLGVAVAEDGSVGLFPREGDLAGGPEVLLAMTALESASRIAAVAADWRPAAIVVDNSGRRAAGLLDALRTLGVRALAVSLKGRADDPSHADRRAEAMAAADAWSRRTGQAGLAGGLGRAGDVSPHIAALAATFAAPVAPPARPAPDRRCAWGA